MAAEWFYTSNRQQMGPVSWNELCRLADDGRLRPADLVWKEGMPDWVRASSSGVFPESKPKRSEDADYRPRRGDDDRPPRGELSRGEASRDDFDDDFDRPRRRRRRSEGMPVGAKVALIVGGVTVLLVIVAVTLILVLNKSGNLVPQDVPPQGLAFNDTLRFNDPRDSRRNLPCKVFTVNFVANSTYVIDHRSGMFDTYLRLEDPMGVNVAEDDDSGGGLNARIVHRAAQTGTYRVIATSFAGGSGNFTLTVRKN